MVSRAAKISEADVAEFERAGAICLRGLFDQSWIERLRAAIQRRIDAGPGILSRQQNAFSFTELFMSRSDPDFRAFVFDSPAASIAAQLMRSKSARFYFDQIFSRDPGMEEPTPWHNDQPFYPISGTQVCSVWLALDVVTKESSGLEYIAGSHRWESVVDGSLPDLAAIAHKCEFLNWNMQPGDCLVHSGLTVHGASGNSTTDTRRRALATRWIGDDVVYRAREKAREELKIPGLATGDPIPPGDQFPKVEIAF